jgi:hypothetical protein
MMSLHKRVSYTQCIALLKSHLQTELHQIVARGLQIHDKGCAIMAQHLISAPQRRTTMEASRQVQLQQHSQAVKAALQRKHQPKHPAAKAGGLLKFSGTAV